MKKVFCIVVFAILISANMFSQNVVTLGNFILEHDDFTTSKSILQDGGFLLYSDEAVRSFGHNPSIVVLGTKGSEPSTVVLALVTAISPTNRGIKEVMFICTKSQSMNVESNLKNAGYKYAKEREYMEDGRLKIREKTYQRIEAYASTVIVKFSKDGSARVIFKNASK